METRTNTEEIIDTEMVSEYIITTCRDAAGDIEYTIENSATSVSATMYENSCWITFDTASGIEDYPIDNADDTPDDEICAMLLDMAMAF